MNSTITNLITKLEISREPEVRKPTILLVGDNYACAARTILALAQGGFTYENCINGTMAMKVLRERRFDIVVLSSHLDESSTAELVDDIRELHGQTAIIYVNPRSGAPTIDPAEGFFGFPAAPFSRERLMRTIADAALYATGVRGYRSVLEAAEKEAGLVAVSPGMREVISQLWRVAPTNANVLLEGERGTGKEMLARMLHRWSYRAHRQFITIDCRESAALKGAQLRLPASALAHLGSLESAVGGTLFLDHVDDASIETQGRLSHAIERRVPVDIDESLSNVRTVAASSRDLDAALGAGAFRDDLYFRLSVVPLRIPPLRERPDDILMLAKRMISSYRIDSREDEPLPPRVERALLSHNWPGNVRELQNRIERAIVLSDGRPLTPESLGLKNPGLPAAQNGPQSIRFADGRLSSPKETLREVLDHAAATHIRMALAESGGSAASAATMLGVDRATLSRLMKHFQMSASSVTGSALARRRPA